MIILGAEGDELDMQSGNDGVDWHKDLYGPHWSMSGMLMHRLA